MVGLFIALIGLTFLLGAFNVLSEKVVGVVWPILVVLIGMQTIMRNKCKCCSAT